MRWRMFTLPMKLCAIIAQQQKCVSPHHPEFSCAEPFLQFTHLPIEAELLPRELCCSVPKGPPLWFATQRFQVNQILRLPGPPSCFQLRRQQSRSFLSVLTLLLFSVSHLSFLQKIKILYLMKWGITDIFFPRGRLHSCCCFFFLNNGQRSQYRWIHDSEHRILKRKLKEILGGGVRNVYKALLPQSYWH